MAASLGSLVVSLGLDASEYVAGLTKSEYQAKRFGDALTSSFSTAQKVLGALGASLSVGAVVAFTKNVITSTAALEEMSAVTGASIANLAQFNEVARIGGYGLDTVESALVRLSKSLGGTGEGAGRASAALKAVGLSKDELKNLDPGDALKVIADRLNQFSDGTGKTAFALAVLGKSGAGALPFLKDLANTTTVLRQATEEEALQARNLEKGLQLLGAQTTELKRGLVLNLLPSLTDITEAMNAAAKEGSILMTVWVGMGGVGANFAGLTDRQQKLKKIQELDQQLVVAQKQLDAGTLSPTGANKSFFSFLVPDVKLTEESKTKLRATIASLKAERDKLAPPDATPIVPKKKPDVPFAEDATANEALRKLLDTQAKIKVDAIKEAGQREEAILEIQHQDSLVSEQTYWQQKVGIQKTALDAELKVLDDQIARQRASSAKAVPNSKEYYEIQTQLAEALGKRNKLEADFGQVVSVSYLLAQRAAKEYRRSVQDIEAQILELEGKTVEATKARLALSDEDLRKKFTVNQDADALAKLDKLEKLKVAQAEFNKATENESAITARLAIEEERIQNSQRVGAIGEIEALKRTGDARAAALVQLQKEVENKESIAKLSQNRAEILQAEQARAALEKLRSETDLLAQKFDSIFKDSFSDAFASVIDGSKSASDAFKDFSNTVVKEISKMVAQSLASKLFGGVTGQGGVGSIFAGIFGGGASTPAAIGPNPDGSNLAGGGGGLGGLFSSFLSFLPSFDAGSSYVPNNTLAFVHRGETILRPGQKSDSAMSFTLVQNFPKGTDKRSSDQAATAAGTAVQRALNRNS